MHDCSYLQVEDSESEKDKLKKQLASYISGKSSSSLHNPSKTSRGGGTAITSSASATHQYRQEPGNGKNYFRSDL